MSCLICSAGVRIAHFVQAYLALSPVQTTKSISFAHSFLIQSNVMLTNDIGESQSLSISSDPVIHQAWETHETALPHLPDKSSLPFNSSSPLSSSPLPFPFPFFFGFL